MENNWFDELKSKMVGKCFSYKTEFKHKRYVQVLNLTPNDYYNNIFNTKRVVYKVEGIDICKYSDSNYLVNFFYNQDCIDQIQHYGNEITENEFKNILEVMKFVREAYE